MSSSQKLILDVVMNLKIGMPPSPVYDQATKHNPKSHNVPTEPALTKNQNLLSLSSSPISSSSCFHFFVYLSMWWTTWWQWRPARIWVSFVSWFCWRNLSRQYDEFKCLEKVMKDMFGGIGPRDNYEGDQEYQNIVVIQC